MKGSVVANAHAPRPAAVLDYISSVVVCEDIKALTDAYKVCVVVQRVRAHTCPVLTPRQTDRQTDRVTLSHPPHVHELCS